MRLVRLLLPLSWRLKIRRVINTLLRNHAYHEREHRAEFFRRAWVALGFNGISGDYVEFGSHSGSTFGLSFKASRAVKLNPHCWAFDSFCGLPPPTVSADAHPAWIKGALATSLKRFKEVCSANGLRESDYTAVAGFYSDTLGERSNSEIPLPADISLAYIDCDLFSSTKTVLEFLGTRLKHGMIVALDDYYCWSRDALAGERRALKEFVSSQRRFRFAPYLQFGWHGMAFVVEDVAQLHGVTGPLNSYDYI